DWPRPGEIQGRRGYGIVRATTGGRCMDQRIINLYDKFIHGGMSRREFMDDLARLVGSAAAATALLPILQNDYAKAEVVPANDPRLNAETTSTAPPKATGPANLCRPKGTTSRPPSSVTTE